MPPIACVSLKVKVTFTVLPNKTSLFDFVILNDASAETGIAVNINNITTNKENSFFITAPYEFIITF